MSEAMKKVSVIVPVYNVELYVKECLDSLLAQTLSGFEIVAVDDGSTDGSGKILDEYAAKDSRIHVIHEENGGLAHARNTGIAASTGELIACVDGDDTVAPGFLEKLEKPFESGDYDVSVCDLEYHYEDGHVEDSSGGSFSHTSARVYPKLVLINNSACNKLCRKSLFEDLPFPDGKLYEDLATMPAIIYKAESVVKVNEPLYYYRQRSGSIRHTLNDGLFDIYDAIGRVKKYVEDHGNEAEILEELNHLYIIHALDAITLKIKDGDDRKTQLAMLEENMKRLKEAYPDYRRDPYYVNAGFKKKLIWKELAKGKYERVLKLYGK